jgi:uncharacterized ion transporter superfamily protein YfcC
MIFKYILEHYTFFESSSIYYRQQNLYRQHTTKYATSNESTRLMSKRNLALVGATLVSIIYGLTFTIKGCNATIHRCLWFHFFAWWFNPFILVGWLFMPKEK